MVSRGELLIPLRLADEAEPIKSLLQRYDNVPMSLADACLVRLSELHEPGRILTLDRDFTVYRRHGRKPIETIMPDA